MSTGALTKALAAFQAEMPTVAKSKTAKVGQYSYTYAGLAEVSHVGLPLLSKHGLAFSCCPRRTESGHYELAGFLLHVSGEEREGSLPISGGTPQQLGSAITYARRYLFGSMTGLITEDDDDGQIAAAQTAKRAPAKKAERIKATPPDDPWLDAAPKEPGDRQISDEQMKKLHALFGELGITDRDKRLLYANDVLGLEGERAITTSNQLSRSQASRVIDALTKDSEQPFPTPPEETP